MNSEYISEYHNGSITALALFLSHVPPDPKASPLLKERLSERGQPLCEPKTLMKTSVTQHFNMSVRDLSVIHVIINARLSMN